LLQGRERVLANSQSFAINLSEWAACGDWRLFFLHRDRVEKVTAEDVNRVAAKYLIRSNRTVGMYVPTKKPERAEVPTAPTIQTLVGDYKGRTAITAGEAFDPTPANVEARVKRGKIGDVEFAYLNKKTRGETVNLTMSLRFGSEESLKGNVAACDFVGAMLLRGTKTKTRQEIKDAFDKLNASVSVSSDLGVLNVTIQTKRDNLPATLALLREVLREPVFPASEFDLLVREQLEGLDKSKTDPQALASNLFRRKINVYPKDDVRYAPTLDEAIAMYKAVKIEQVKALYESQIGGLGQLAIVGDFDADEVTKQVGLIVDGWKAKTPFKRIERPAQTVKGGTEQILTPDKPNAVYIAGLPLPMTDKDADYPALVLGNYILGAAPLASRLSNRVRGKEGLSYGVGSQAQASPLDKGGVFLMFAITNPMNMAKVDATIAEELNKFLKEGVSATEVEEAKKAYLQFQTVMRGNDGMLASELSRGLFAGRTFEYTAELEKKLEALQPGDIQKAFDKYIKPKDLVIIQSGDLKK
jgi:zinc protease